MEKNLLETYLEILGRRKLYPALNGYSIFIQGSEYNTKKYYEKWYNNQVQLDLFILIKEGFSQVWLPENDLKKAAEIVFNEFIKDRNTFEKRYTYLMESIVEINKLYEEYTYKKIKESSWDELFEIEEKIRNIIWDVNGAVIFTIYLDKELLSSFLEKYNYPISTEELDIVWYKATEPYFESFDKTQLFQFLKLKNNNLDDQVLLETFQYILTDYHSARTLEEVRQALSQRYATWIEDINKCDNTLIQEQKELEEKRIQHEQWSNSLPENEKILVEYLQLVMKIRDRRKNFFAKATTIMYRIAERMFEEENVSRNLIPFYSIRELLKGSQYLKENQKEITERKLGFEWLVPYEGEVLGVNKNIENDVVKINERFKSSHTSEDDKQVVKGQVAFRGNIKGKVRIVLNANSDHNFKDGEILVTGMTRPEFVPLMKKASAIVTDEGGITCHAAIVSRELKVPCVIGTKIATKVFKDGDMVEVDANGGIIRKIN